MTSMTVPRPAMAPSFTRIEPQRTPVASMPTATGSATFSGRVGNHSSQQAGNQDVKNGADHQRSEDADGHVLLRVLGFLRGGRDGVESDVGEEDDTGGARDPRPPILAECSLVGRDEGMPVRGGQRRMLEHERTRNGDEDQHDRHLDNHDGRVEVGRFLDADHQDGGDQADDQKGHAG